MHCIAGRAGSGWAGEGDGLIVKKPFVLSWSLQLLDLLRGRSLDVWTWRGKTDVQTHGPQRRGF